MTRNLDALDKILYQEELKRPAEFTSNSWLSTYRNDPIACERMKCQNDYKCGRISREEAENRINIAEADDHYNKRGITWDYPDKIDLSGKMRIPVMANSCSGGMANT